MNDSPQTALAVLLGQDFLTWLWCQSERRNGVFATQSGEAFFLSVEQKVAVVGGEGESLERTTVSGRMSELKEARMGVGTGKKVHQALIRLEKDTNEWTVLLKAEDFSFAGFRTPKIEAKLEEGDEPDAVFLEKMFLMELGISCLDSAFTEFVAKRFGPDWDEEEAGVRRWVAQP